MKKCFLITVLALAALVAWAGGEADSGSEYKLAFQAPTVHPFFDEVQKGVEAYEADSGIEIRVALGPDWTQDSQNQGVEGLAAAGYNGFSVYPADPSGANGLYRDLVDAGRYVVNFGTSTLQPTPASFAIATDVKTAAMDATEHLIQLMGEQGNILNVLEVVTDANTVLRKQGIEEVVARYPNVQIVQEIGDMTSIEESLEKIESALSAQLGNVDGIICTGYTTSVAAAQLLTEINAPGAADNIRMVGIDTDEVVLNAIRDGYVDATIAQNPFGQGYLSMKVLTYLIDGWTPMSDQYFIDSGTAVVTADNIDSFAGDLESVTDEIATTLETVYLTQP